jgi:hypothetical protein
MKKITSALLAAIACVSAASAATTGTTATGFYAGLNAGAANTNVKATFTNANSTSGGLTSINTVNTKYDAGKMAYLFGAFGGYGLQLGQSAYVGFELYGGFDSTKVSPFDDSASGGINGGLWKTTVKRTNFYGLKPRVGLMVTPSTLAYIGLGIEGGKWKVQYAPNLNQRNSAATSTIAGTASANSVNASKGGLAFAPTVGFDMFVSKNLFVRAEYSYLFGPKVTFNTDISAFGDVTGNVGKLTFLSTQHAFKVGVGY